MPPGIPIGRIAARSIERRLGSNKPYFCSWYVTSKCTKRCKGCVFYERLRTSGPDLSRIEALGVLDELIDSRLPVLIFVGGEPLLREDLPVLLERAHKAGMYTVVFTSGDVLTPDAARAFSPHLNAMIVSLDGFGQGHDAVRGRGSFAAAWQGLVTYMENRTVKESAIYANIGLHKGSMSTVPTLIKDLLSLDVDKIKLQPNFIPEFKPDPDEALPVVDEIEKFQRRRPDKFLADSRYLARLRTYFSRHDNREFCGASSLSHIAILPDGTVSACCDFLLPLGGLRDQSLAAILKAADASVVAERARKCMGCCRRDYQLVQEVLDAPLREFFGPGPFKRILEFASPR